MPELRKDLINEHWVALANGEALKPCDFPIARKRIVVQEEMANCPFCAGRETMTPEAIRVVSGSGQNWKMRVVPNKFTAFNLQGSLVAGDLGIYSYMNGLGSHEVLIETPDHYQEIQDYQLADVRLYLEVLRERYMALATDSRIKYIQIYKNRGMLAGATMAHSHSQILGFPVVPNINPGGLAYYREHHHCLFCDLLLQDLNQSDRIIYQGEHFVLLCPYAARYAYSAWLIPRMHIRHFYDLSENAMSELAILLKCYIRAMLKVLNDCSYNVIMNTAPIEEGENGYHWCMEINPRLSIASGVEIASGIYMNPVAPELAAVMLKEPFELELATQTRGED